MCMHLQAAMPAFLFILLSKLLPETVMSGKASAVGSSPNKQERSWGLRNPLFPFISCTGLPISLSVQA